MIVVVLMGVIGVMGVTEVVVVVGKVVGEEASGQTRSITAARNSSTSRVHREGPAIGVIVEKKRFFAWFLV